MAHQGRQLFMKLQCIPCHNTQTPRAPVLEEIYGTTRPLRGGGVVSRGRRVHRASRSAGRGQVGEGWEPIMPHFDEAKVTRART